MDKINCVLNKIHYLWSKDISQITQSLQLQQGQILIALSNSVTSCMFLRYLEHL